MAMTSTYKNLILEAENLEAQAQNLRTDAARQIARCKGKHKFSAWEPLLNLGTRTINFERGCPHCGYIQTKEGDGKVLTPLQMCKFSHTRIYKKI